MALGNNMNIAIRKVTESDFDFAFEVKKQAMGPHITAKWGWDEDYQISVHRQRWLEKPWFVLLLNDERIGTVSIHRLENHVRFGEFYILDSYRNKGFGSNFLKQFLSECDNREEKVVLEYLKWNPVGSLYKRFGFKIIEENEIHYFMERVSACA